MPRDFKKYKDVYLTWPKCFECGGRFINYEPCRNCAIMPNREQRDALYKNGYKAVCSFKHKWLMYVDPKTKRLLDPFDIQDLFKKGEIKL